MAVLSQTPFQLPDFAKMAYEKSLVDEEKQRREEERQEAKRNQRERTIEGYGAKKNYLEKGFALEPAAKQIADVAFQEVQKYGTLYEQTNSQEALANFERAVGQFNQILGTGLAVRQAVDNEIESLRKNPSSFSLESQKSGEQAYRDRSNMNFAGAIENGVLMATDPTTGKRVPVTQLSYFQSSVVPTVNTLGLIPVDPATKFINPVDYAQRLVNDFKDTQGVRIDSGTSVTYDKNSLIRKGRASFESDLNNNPAMMDAVIMRHYLKSTGKTPSPQERSQIVVDYNSNPEKLKAAQDTYWSDVSNNITSFVPAASVGARTGGSTSKSKALDFFLQNSTVSAPVLTRDGKQVIRYDNPPLEDISYDNGLYKVERISIDTDGKVLMLINDAYGEPLDYTKPLFKSVYNKALNDMKPYLGQLKRAAISSASKRGKDPYQ